MEENKNQKNQVFSNVSKANENPALAASRNWRQSQRLPEDREKVSHILRHNGKKSI